jgi:hypothetical protein
MDGLSFERDDRDTDPDKSGHRRARFRDGWNNAVNGQQYGTKALKDLTWENLGYRLGCIFGDTGPDLVDELYVWCVTQQDQSQG